MVVPGKSAYTETKIIKVNAISRDFADRKIDLRAAYQRLSLVDQISTKQPALLQCLAAAVMSCVLMVVFTGDTKDTLVAFLVGGFSYWVYLWLVSTFKVRYLGEFCTALVIGALASTAVHLGFAHRVDDIIISEIGLRLRDHIKIVKHEPFEGPVVVKRLTDGQTLNISYKAAHNVFIAPKDK